MNLRKVITAHCGGAAIVTLTHVLHSAFAVHDRSVVGETLYCEVDILCNLFLVVVGVVDVRPMEFVTRNRIGLGLNVEAYAKGRTSLEI